MGIVKDLAIVRKFFGPLVILALALSCSSGPTAPTPPPPPPIADAPILSCPGDGVSRATVNAGGMAVTYDLETASKGEGAVTVSCSPASGENFAIGTTEVKCTATDTLSRKAECSFPVTVAKLPVLSKVKYFAFGDSITAGEITAPVSGSIFNPATLITKQVVVPNSSYPAVLQRQMHSFYSWQASQLVVANYGKGGEKAAVARDRFIAGLNVERPDVVIIIDGANDIPAGENGAASTAASEVRAMVDEAMRRGIRVFVGTPPPGKPGFRQINTFLLVDYVGRMRDVAARSGATLIDFYALMLPEADRLIGIDGLHPNEAGYAKMGEIAFQAIKTAFEVP